MLATPPFLFEPLTRFVVENSPTWVEVVDVAREKTFSIEQHGFIKPSEALSTQARIL
jgi:hypothetical protein